MPKVATACDSTLASTLRTSGSSEKEIRFRRIQLLGYLDDFHCSNLRDESFQARATGLCLVGHHPIHSRRGYANGPGLNAAYRLGCSRSPRLAPYFSMFSNQ